MNERRLKKPSAPKFLVDDMLGGLARRLRMLGFDAQYERRRSLVELWRKAEKEGRLLLTRKTLIPLMKLKFRPESAVRIIDDDPDLQIAQVLSRCKLPVEKENWFTRCLRCNILLQKVDRDSIATAVPEYIAQNYTDFRACPSCGRIYWKGTHAHHMNTTIENWIRSSDIQKEDETC